ncbi:hypothetical protein CKM354_000459800 [Cercospora kikuchii]|uniref:Apple domain-containing protein n=1 Tax=Cercospora kikuchii TaxID=84275 RepID=A0A9P3CH52_9PEZI|nr:uncharacterized protein CKM354_000459800 [Cercospora kikuchii]GIZ41287.1 hypothetical protein CKM354_000459800 [Cercospora kikuchii]
MKLFTSLTLFAASLVACNTSCKIEKGIDRPGGDYRSAKVYSFDDCGKQCKSDKKCAAVNYHKDSKYCYFKKEVKAKKANENDVFFFLLPILLDLFEHQTNNYKLFERYANNYNLFERYANNHKLILVVHQFFFHDAIHDDTLLEHHIVFIDELFKHHVLHYNNIISSNHYKL